MRKGKLLGIVCAVVVVVGVLIAGCAGPAPAQPAPGSEGPQPKAIKTLKIGATAPLSGPAAPWGINQLRGHEIWADCINDGSLSKFSDKVDPNGGLLIGGEKYKIEFIAIDDKFETSATLDGVKKLAMMDKAMFQFPSITYAAGALGDLCQSLGVLMMQVAGQPDVIGPGRSLVYNVADDEGEWQSMMAYYALDAHPDAKRVAIIGPDMDSTRYGIAFAWMVAESKDREVVFTKTYPLDTVDYHPLMTAVLATKPDIVIQENGYPNDTALCIEAAYQAGYKGYWCANTYVLSLILPKVPAEQVQGYSGGWTYGGWTDSPSVPEEARWYIQKWNDKFGADTWTTSSPANYAANRVLQVGIEAADSIDPAEVAAALDKLDPVPHPMGPSKWGGNQFFGIDHGLKVPLGAYEIDENATQGFDTKTIYTYPYPWGYDPTKYPNIPKEYTDPLLKIFKQ